MLLGHLFPIAKPLRNLLRNKHRKNSEKHAKIEDFGIPKPSQNGPKMHPKSMFQKTWICLMHFWYVFHFCYVRFLKNINFPLGKLMFLRFLLKTHFCNFRTFFFEKLPKNPSKTKPGRLKNRCQKYVVFRHEFFRVLISILEPLGPPSWSQVGYFGLKKLGAVLPKSLLKIHVF